jgi:hypothetical protein
VTGGLRAGDPARAAIVAAALIWSASADAPLALGFALVAPPALALRMLPAPQWLDGALCAVLVTAQVGAAAGFTHSTGWWDAAAHAVTASLVALLVISLIPAGWLSRLAIPVVFALGLAWEGVEWVSDTALGTTFVPSRADTVGDLLFDLAGAVVATATLGALRWLRAPQSSATT